MTIDEAISIMNVIVHMLEPQYDTDRIEEAVEMAIKALEQQPTDAVDRVTIKEYLDSFGTDTNVTATDCISREAVIKTITEWLFSKEFYYTNATEYLRKRLDELPPVTPQPKMGRWITWKEAGNDIPSETRFECSVCHDAAQTLCNGLDLLSTYCPNCGAKMQEIQTGAEGSEE